MQPTAPREDAAPADAAPVPVDAARRVTGKVFVTGAGRCGECHEKMYDEWEVSAHAQGATSALYKTARAAANDASCDRCHAPLGAALGAQDPLASEGVTCDVCHTLRDAAPSAEGAGFRLAIDDMVKFGPRCDLKDHYFHRMGCSPEHTQAQLCGTCHWWEPKGVPVFTEFKDWRDGPAAKANQSCQSCHMPKEAAVIAVGSPRRQGVPHHGLLGLATDLRARALALEVSARNEAGAVAVDVAVTNTTAGHHIPAGLPERRIVVEVRARDDKGGDAAPARTTYLGRSLGDATGKVVPFWRATQVLGDTRIAPGATWKDRVTFAALTAGTIEVEVRYHGLSPEAAASLGVQHVERVVLARAELPLAQLPKTVTVKPPAAGKRTPQKKVAP